MEKPLTKNSRPGRLKGVYPDGKNIRDLRLAKGWKQQELANAAKKIPLRSVQRAEEGKHRMDPATLRDIAHALEVDFDKVTVAEPFEQQRGVQPSNRHEVRLSPTVSADEILTQFQWIEPIEFRLKGDFDTDQAEKIAETFELIELLHRCRWTTDEISYTDQIRKQGKLNDLLKSLSATGLRIFIGTYTCRLTGSSLIEGTDEIPPNVFRVEVSIHGLITASFAKQRTISYTVFTGDSEEDQARQIRRRIAAGGWIYSWSGLEKLRRELELEFGRELRSWKDDESPF
jgi:transcriptional regulator with XRE-family HTH domain